MSEHGSNSSKSTPRGEQHLDPLAAADPPRRQSSRSRTLTEKGEQFSNDVLLKLINAFLAHNDKMLNYIQNFDIESENKSYISSCIAIYDNYYATFLDSNKDINEYLDRSGLPDADATLEQQELRFQDADSRHQKFMHLLKCNYSEANAKLADDLLEKMSLRSHRSAHSKSKVPSIPIPMVNEFKDNLKLQELEKQKYELKQIIEEKQQMMDEFEAENKKLRAQRILQLENEIKELKKDASQFENESKIKANNPHLSLEQDLDIIKYERTRQFVQDVHTKSPPSSSSKSRSDILSTSSRENRKIKGKILLKSLQAFDDQPEHFAFWKTSFIEITAELQTSPLEELELLTQNLGSSSKRYANSIRVTNPFKPKEALSQIWKFLDKQFGGAERVENSIKAKLSEFPAINHSESSKYIDLFLLCQEIESLKNVPQYSKLLAYFDASSGVNLIVEKLPFTLQNEWNKRLSSYVMSHDCAYPPFEVFVKFIEGVSNRENFAGRFVTSRPSKPKPSGVAQTFTSRKTKIEADSTDEIGCPLHKNSANNHPLRACRRFTQEPFTERQRILTDNDICTRCCNSYHRPSNCKVTLKCEKCDKTNHTTLMHNDAWVRAAMENHGGEKPKTSGARSYSTSTLQSAEATDADSAAAVVSRCAKLRKDKLCGRSCGKIVLAKLHQVGDPKSIDVYAVIDDQATHTLALPNVIDQFENETWHEAIEVETCAGTATYVPRVAKRLSIAPYAGGPSHEMENVFECEDIPWHPEEIPTPDVANAYAHLRRIAKHIPPYRRDVSMVILIGRDQLPLHHVLEQVVGDDHEPFAQKLRLGWTVIGEVRLGKMHKPNSITVRKIGLLPCGRATPFTPCDASIALVPATDTKKEFDIFASTERDKEASLSTDDREFLSIMETQMVMDDGGKWIAPLPFK